MQAQDFKRLHLVIVDDNASIRSSYRALFLNIGCAVYEASSADEALNFLEGAASFVDLVLTDIEMPGSMNGIGLANVIGARWPEIAMIVSSGGYCPVAGELPTGAVFVPKPNTAETLLQLLASLTPEPHPHANA